MQQATSDNLLHTQLEKGRRYRLGKGHVVQSSDTRQVINLVKKGYIKRYLIRNDGTLGIQAIYGPGDVFPLTIVFQALFNQDIYKGPEVYHYETMTEVELFTINQSTLVESVDREPTMYRGLLIEAGKRFNSNIQQLENLSLKSSYNRLAHQLLYFAKKFGIPVEEGVKIQLPLSHQDIGDVLSLTRETVSNNIKDLRNADLVKTSSSSRQIVVLDMDKLEEAAYG